MREIKATIAYSLFVDRDLQTAYTTIVGKTTIVCSTSRIDCRLQYGPLKPPMQTGKRNIQRNFLLPELRACIVFTFHLFVEKIHIPHAIVLAFNLDTCAICCCFHTDRKSFATFVDVACLLCIKLMFRDLLATCLYVPLRKYTNNDKLLCTAFCCFYQRRSRWFILEYQQIVGEHFFFFNSTFFSAYNNISLIGASTDGKAKTYKSTIH